MLDKFQSGFRAFHSTETALLKVMNDILCCLDSGDGVILVFLDLSAAFDTIDHSILLNHLERVVSFQGVALSRFSSYLEGRTFSVNMGKHNSSSALITCGVPQDSILSLLLFSLYMLPLGSIFQKYDVSYHCYGDDTQFYLPVKSKGEVKRGCQKTS